LLANQDIERELILLFNLAPSQPRSLISRAVSSSEIEIEWEEPREPNGKITHYKVIGNKDDDSYDFINQRNYCLERKQERKERNNDLLLI